MIRPSEIRISAVNDYLNNGMSLRAVARKYNIHYLSVRKWSKWHKEKGEARLKIPYILQKRTIPREIETKIVLLKENNPSLTVKAAQGTLEKQNIKISAKGIWHIWKRYGYAGFNKTNVTGQPKLDTVAKYYLSQTKHHLNNGSIKKAAEIINSIPTLPESQISILENIPDRYLSLQRRVDKLSNYFGHIPYSEYYNNVRKLRQQMEKKELFYCGIRAGLQELYALEWMGEPKKQILLINHLRTRMPKRDQFFKFSLLIGEGIAHIEQLKFDTAGRILKKVNRIMGRKPFLSTLYNDVAVFNSYFGNYRMARIYGEKALEQTTDEKDLLKTNLALFIAQSGDYRHALRILNEVRERYQTLKYIILAKGLFALGKIDKVFSLANKALEECKKDDAHLHLHNISVILSSAYAAIGESRKSKLIIKKFNPVLTKYYMKREVLLRNYLIDDKLLPAKTIRADPFINVIYRLRKGKNYNEVIRFIDRHGLWDAFYRFCIFFPEIIINRLRYGKQTFLPRALLKFPVFNKEIPVYNIKFLGSMVVYKNQKYLKVKLKPKDAAFLIYLCQNLMEPKKSVNLDEVYANFWPKSEKAARNFSHLLVRVKKALKLPAHLLVVSRGYGLPSLINEGIYFTTDYQEFEQVLVQAKALERAGEWDFAKKEYLRAFKLFRGEPFKKNFDEWSLNMRFKILNQFEPEAINFAKSCIEHKNRKDAEQVLKKVSKIIADSEEAKRLLDSLTV